MSHYDLLITNVKVVRAGKDAPEQLDVAISGGKFAEIAPSIDPGLADKVVDAGGKHLFPGVVDGHQHWGIYNPLSEDADIESRANAQGGVTTGLT